MNRFFALSLLLSLVSTSGCGGPTSGPEDAGSQPDAFTADARPTLDTGSDAWRDDASAPDAASDPDADVDAASEIPDAGDLPDVMVADGGFLPPCVVGEDRCGGDVCLDLGTERDNCGVCGFSCMTGAHVLGSSCHAGRCQLSACDPGYADLNHSGADGCEAAQDFSIALASPTITVSTGGSAALDVDITRINGFPYALSVGVTGVPSDVSAIGASLTVDSPAPIVFSAAALAFTGSYPITINVGGSVGGTSVTHSLPATLVVVSSPVNVTSVTVFDATGPLPSNQARQGQGTVTLRLAGTGLSLITAATLELLTLTPVAGGTDTTRDYTTNIASNTGVNGNSRSFTLRLSTTSGETTIAGALVVTPLVVSPTGSNTGHGTLVSPFQTIRYALGVAGTGSRVILQPGSYAYPGGVSAPDGFMSIGRASGAAGSVTIDCGGIAGAVGFTAASSVLLNDLTITGCSEGVHMAGHGDLLLTNVTIAGATTLATVQTGDSLRWHGGSATIATGGSAGMLSMDGPGTLDLQHVVPLDARITTTGTNVALLDARLSAATSGLSITGAPSCGLFGVVFLDVVGTALSVSSSSCDMTEVLVQGGTGPGVVLRSATVRGTYLSVIERGGDAATDGAFVVQGTGSRLVGQPSATVSLGLNADRNTIPAIRVRPDASALAQVELHESLVTGNVVGILLDATTASARIELVADATTIGMNADCGLRVLGGATTGGTVDITTTDTQFIDSPTLPTSTLVELGAGTGSVDLGAVWDVRAGHGLVVGALSGHTVTLRASSRTPVMFSVLGHPYTFGFGLEDLRTGASVTPIQVLQGVFVGSDGANRSWSGTFHGPVGSYSASVSPRDIASWVITRNGAITFVD